MESGSGGNGSHNARYAGGGLALDWREEVRAADEGKGFASAGGGGEKTGLFVEGEGQVCHGRVERVAGIIGFYHSTCRS